jgi:hypothetical protein
MEKAEEDQRTYSKNQLTKLKGFCCVKTSAGLPEIWDYFKSTKEVDAQRTQLVEEMKKWVSKNEVPTNRSIYFDKATMDDIVKMDFCPGTLTAYLTTAEQGISIFICRPRTGAKQLTFARKSRPPNSSQGTTPLPMRSYWAAGTNAHPQRHTTK